MNPKLETAIFVFLGDKFHLDPQRITTDTNFQTDLHLSPDQLLELLQEMQDALNFTLPEDKPEAIATIADLFSAIIESQEDSDEQSDTYDPAD